MSFSVDKALRKAKIHLKSGDLGEAKATYKLILSKFPKNVKALQGYEKTETVVGSKVSFTKELQQNQVQDLLNLYNLGRFEDVICKVQPLISLFPNALVLFNLQGASNVCLQRYDAAIKSYQVVLRINPDFAEGYYNIANAFQDKGDLVAAIENYKKSVKIKPDYVESYNNMGMALRDMGEADAAITSCQQALAIKPDHAEAFYNMANALRDKGKTDAAIKSFENAIKIQPNYANAHNNLGNALSTKGRVIEPILSYQTALNINPDYQLARGQKLFQQAHICDWAGIREDQDLVKELGTDTQHIDPFAILSLEDAPDRHKMRSETYARNTFKQPSLPLSAPPLQKPERLRIGYFSADFHNHATMYLMAKFFEAHDLERFEIYAYSFGPDINDKMRSRLVSAVTVFDDVRDMKDYDIALLAQQDKIDIAVDLKGYTKDCRAGIFAHRAAPIQVSYIGYPGTMGAPFIDYIVADKIVIPPNKKKCYSENIIYMPNCYQVNDNTREISDRPMHRSNAGLPEDAFVFCCFNSNYKITPVEFDIWMQLLHHVEGSVLWLLKSNQWSNTNLRLETERRGISADRLIFAEKVPHAEHLARHRMADLFIDTFNVNAHTTASDALWAGLPVVTKIGQGFAARVAGSLLEAIDLPELIVKNDKDYETLILDLANNPIRLDAVKTKLSANRCSKPLFDTELFTKQLEDAFQQAYQRYFVGKAPCDILVSK